MASTPAVSTASRSIWPPLPFEAWKDTYATLHMMAQIVGKVRLAWTPALNHTWQVPLYVTARGLATSPIPNGARTFEIRFDFIDHELIIETDTGDERRIRLVPRAVADFYREMMEKLASLGLETRIWTMPVEVPGAVIRFEEDRTHTAYDPEWANRLWQVLVQVDRVLKKFRARYLGKASPVHFFWGAFDIAATRFSGRPAPPHPGGAPNLADWVMRDAYSHEVSSCGFWPGSADLPQPVFYAYAYPEPTGFAAAAVQPGGAFYSTPMKEFLLPYDSVREAADPEAALLAFCQSTYEAAADLGGWDRKANEWSDPRPTRKGRP
jgi:Family of unknown function (DUF5996)